MCLAVPGQLEAVQQRDGARTGQVTFGGVTREVALDFVPEADVGDWVLVHVGFALGVIDAEEAARTLEDLGRVAELAEGAAPPDDERAP